MRLWSLHPRYLDVKGLTACWREALLARKVLLGETVGYRNHPQLGRFLAQPDPLAAIDAYLAALYDEASSRGYRFDRAKIGLHAAPCTKIGVTEGQLRFEREHLRMKLELRDPQRMQQLNGTPEPEPHPLFVRTEGKPEKWEKR